MHPNCHVVEANSSRRHHMLHLHCVSIAYFYHKLTDSGLWECYIIEVLVAFCDSESNTMNPPLTMGCVPSSCWRKCTVLPQGCWAECHLLPGGRGRCAGWRRPHSGRLHFRFREARSRNNNSHRQIYSTIKPLNINIGKTSVKMEWYDTNSE